MSNHKVCQKIINNNFMIELSPDNKKSKETLSEVNVSNQKLDVSAESKNCPTGYDPYWWNRATAKRPTENFVSSFEPLFPYF